MKTPEEWSRKIYDEYPSPVSGRASMNSEFVRLIQADALRRLVEACGSIDNDISTPTEWDEAYAEARDVLDSRNDTADHGSCAVAVCSRCAELEREIAKLKEELDWQNMPNRREPFRGGWEFYINEEWTAIRDAAMGEDAGFRASLMKARYDPDDERVRIRRVLDDDAILQDLAEARKALDSSANSESEGPARAFTLSELEAKARAWSEARAVMTDDNEIHPQSSLDFGKLLAFVRGLFTSENTES